MLLHYLGFDLRQLWTVILVMWCAVASSQLVYSQVMQLKTYPFAVIRPVSRRVVQENSKTCFGNA